MTKISVIITVYNCDKYLKETLDSVLAQTIDDFEVICVDDASTDQTPNILKEYGDRVTIVTNTVNQFAGNSRNIGMQRATGEYLVFLDADDLYEPKMLETAYCRAEETQADIVIWREDLENVETGKRSLVAYADSILSKKKNTAFSPLELKEYLFMLWHGWAWDKMFRRSFVQSTGLFFQGTKSSNDALFVHSAIASAQRISMVDEVFVHHRISVSDSVSASRSKSYMDGILYLKKLGEFLKQNEIYEQYKRAYTNWCIDFLYWNYHTLDMASRGPFGVKAGVFLDEELNISALDRAIFYNNYYYNIAMMLVRHEWDRIPLKEEDRWRLYCKLQKDKLREILNDRATNILWGAGMRSRILLETIPADTYNVIVVDSDEKKWGQEIVQGIIINNPAGILGKENGARVLVLNARILSAVQKRLADIDVEIWDLDTCTKYGTYSA